MTCWSPPSRETSRRRLPAAARGAGAAVGHADRHQHRHRRRREHARLRADRRLGDPAQGAGRADDPCDGDALGLDVPLGDVEIGADAAPGLFPPAQAAGAAGLRDRAQALRPAGGVADRAGDAAEEVRLDQPAPGVPQDDPRHGRRGRAARLQRSRSVEGDVVLVRARGRLAAEAGEGPAARIRRSTTRVRAAAPGYDPYWLEAEWLRLWAASGRPPLRAPRRPSSPSPGRAPRARPLR